MASRNIAFKVINARTVPFAPLAADLAVGYTNESGAFTELFIIPDFILKKSPAKGYYFSGPSKPFIKDGEHQVDANGFKRYLDFFKLASEKKPGDEKGSLTKESAGLRKHIIGLMVEALNQLGGESSAPARAERAPARSAAKASAPAKATRPAAAATAIDEEEIDFPGGEDDDDDMPF